MEKRALKIIKRFIPRKLFLFLQPLYHFFLAFWAALFYGFPSRRIRIVGVTGTKGKTTAVELMHEILTEAGFKVASLSSLRFRTRDAGTRNDLKMTMPGRFFVQRFLHNAVKSGCQYVVLEVTSEGIKQFRHRFINFKVAAMTNVSPEHIEAHGGFEKYLRAKLDLFWRLPRTGTAVLNKDDPNFQRFSAATGASKIFYGKDAIEINGSKLAVRDISISDKGIEFNIDGTTIFSPLLGEFNFYNILAVVALGLGEHVSLDKISSAVSGVSGLPGRMEFVQWESFAALVDYAHTPESLRGVYRTLREFNKFKSLICVLGSAGGGRDKWKRPEMGKIAAEFCDEIILTNEDPYDENPVEILEQIAQGFQQLPAVRKILDRREAISEALKSAKPGDVVVITGKGAEQWIMEPDNIKIPWDDREIVKSEIRKLGLDN